MRTSVAFASLLLLLLATTAHGIRLDRQLQGPITKKQKTMVYPTTSGEASVIARSANKHCRSPDDGHCSSSGTTTKISLTHAESGAAKHMQSSTTGNGGHTMTTAVDADDTTTPHGRHEAEAPSHGCDDHQLEATSRVPPQRETYRPDIMDIAGTMDYSPATRRSPIHN